MQQLRLLHPDSCCIMHGRKFKPKTSNIQLYYTLTIHLQYTIIIHKYFSMSMKGLIAKKKKKKKERGSCTKPLRLKDLRRRPCYIHQNYKDFFFFNR